MKLLGPDIYEGILKLELKTDLQGWHSDHPIFEHLIGEVKPKTIIEVGSWKGASAIHMAHTLQKLNGNRSGMSAGGMAERAWRIYCVDTWLGSREIWNNPEIYAAEPRRHGFPQVYFQFLHNVYAERFADRITPVPMPSRLGAEELKANGVQADLIYLDGSHDFCDVDIDLRCYWGLLRPGGVMFGDDFNWVGVRTAVTGFAYGWSLAVEEVQGNFWILRKPAVSDSLLPEAK